VHCFSSSGFSFCFLLFSLAILANYLGMAEQDWQKSNSQVLQYHDGFIKGFLAFFFFGSGHRSQSTSSNSSLTNELAWAAIHFIGTSYFIRDATIEFCFSGSFLFPSTGSGSCFKTGSNWVSPIILLKSGMKRRIALTSALQSLLKATTASAKRGLGFRELISEQARKMLILDLHCELKRILSLLLSTRPCFKLLMSLQFI